MRHAVSTAALLAMTVALGACSSTPDPVVEPVDETPVASVPTLPPPPPPPPAVVAPPAPPPAVIVDTDPNAPLPGSLDDFAYQAGGDRVFFGYDQSTLSAEALATLRGQADWLNSYPGTRAVIEGHADERGTREYNLALGARRAEAVKDFLVSQGVEASRLTVVSYGKERPIDGRSNAEGWARNRNGFTNITSGAIG